MFFNTAPLAPIDLDERPTRATGWESAAVLFLREMPLMQIAGPNMQCPETAQDGTLPTGTCSLHRPHLSEIKQAVLNNYMGLVCPARVEGLRDISVRNVSNALTLTAVISCSRKNTEPWTRVSADEKLFHSPSNLAGKYVMTKSVQFSADRRVDSVSRY